MRSRPSGASEWRNAPPLAFDGTPGEYRGSLVELTPGTLYDIELTLSGVGQAVFQAATRSETFPVAQTVELPELSSATLTITQGGTPDGYVLYTHAPGASATIDVQDLWDYGVVIKASYVILRGVNVRGAHKYAVYIPYTGVYTDAVIEENDISGWGAWEGAFENVAPKLSETPGAIRRPSPAMGQHNDEVCLELLGLSQERYADLKWRKVV